MSVIVIVPPVSVVTAEEAIAARVFPEDDDPTFVQMLLDAAQGQIDGPKGWLGRSIGFQTLEYRADDFCAPIKLPCPPVINVLSVGYLDSAGAVVVIDGAAYRIFGSEGERIEAAYGATWPTPIGESDAVRIQYEAGYEEEDIPAPMKHAIMLMAAGLKDSGIDLGRVRSETVDGVGRTDYDVPAAVASSMRTTAEKLLGSYWMPTL